jgi:segregation and condensation protein B
MADEELKHAIEAILFASEKPLAPEELKVAFDGTVGVADIRAALEILKNDYASDCRGFSLTEVAGGYQIVTDARFAEVLKKFYQSREKKKISPASLETLSIIAYKQPVTKADIEFIRGVNVDGPLRTLLEKGVIRIAGRKDVPGRPILYGTTREFLVRFGLGSIKDLPPLSEFTQKDIDPNLLPPELKRSEGSEEAEESAGATSAENPEVVQETPETTEGPAVSESPSGGTDDGR